MRPTVRYFLDLFLSTSITGFSCVELSGREKVEMGTPIPSLFARRYCDVRWRRHTVHVSVPELHIKGLILRVKVRR